MVFAIIGANGQLGRELCRLLGPQAWPLFRGDGDLAEPGRLIARLAAVGTEAVINAAAWTAVDLAEDNPEQCHAVNAVAVARLADFCRDAQLPLVQISTDYVFGVNRRQRTPYIEADPVGPLNVYGASKVAAEAAARECPHALIVRTAGLYGRVDVESIEPDAAPRNFVEAILHRALRGERLQVVDDQVVSPSYVPHVARSLLHLLKTRQWGTWHVVNSGETTWHAFAVAVLRTAGIAAPVEAIAAAALARAARRPAYSVLSPQKYLCLSGGPELPDWSAALREAITPSQASRP